MTISPSLQLNECVFVLSLVHVNTIKETGMFDTTNDVIVYDIDPCSEEPGLTEINLPE